MNMPCDVFSVYAKAIEVLEAQETLIAIRSASFSTLTKDGQDKLLKELQRKAYPVSDAKTEPMTTEQAFTFLAGG